MGTQRFLSSLTTDGMWERSCDTGSGAATADDVINDLALGPDGFFAAVGVQYAAAPQDEKQAWIAWYKPDGCLDWQRTKRGMGQGGAAAHGVAVDQSWRHVTVGFLSTAVSGNDIWVAKWSPSEQDTLWEASLINGHDNGDDQARAVAISSENEIVVSGYVRQPGHFDIWVGRFTP